MNKKAWIKPTLILFVLFILGFISPAKPIDPWNLFSLKKIANLIFALAFVQALGSVLISLLGARVGAIITGFLGGLVSSTATTASLARKSLTSLKDEVPAEILTFLSATLAMLLEALAISIYGTTEFHRNFIILFAGPIFTTLLMIVYQTKRARPQQLALGDTELKLLPILKLSAFILSVLTLSKFLQTIFGRAGLLALTFIVSLFEIHGSVIANLQLHESGTLGVQFLGGLLATSIVAASCSKLFLVLTLGSPQLKKSILRTTIVLNLSLAVSGLIFYFV